MSAHIKPLGDREEQLEKRFREADAASTARADGAPSLEPLRFLRVSELMQRPSPGWRVRGVIPTQGLVIVYGASGSGKTFCVLDIAASICLGERWAGRRTKPGVVAYVAAEGHLRSRVQAYLQHREIDDVDLLRVLDSSINLLHAENSLPVLIEALHHVQSEAGPVVAIVIDTLNRVMPGGDENSAEDMGRVIANAKRLEVEFGCAVIFVHHSGKDGSKGSRGHSSLRAACDAEISVRRDGDIRTVTAEKVRDGEDGEILQVFTLKVVDLGPTSSVDPDAEEGERLTSCIVAVADSGACQATAPRTVRREPTGANQRTVLRILRDAIVDVGGHLPATSVIPAGVRGIDIGTLLERAEPKMSGDSPSRRRERVREALDGLIGGHFADKHNDYLWLT